MGGDVTEPDKVKDMIRPLVVSDLFFKRVVKT